jgi:hypothetical protein
VIVVCTRTVCVYCMIHHKWAIIGNENLCNYFLMIHIANALNITLDQLVNYEVGISLPVFELSWCCVYFLECSVDIGFDPCGDHRVCNSNLHTCQCEDGYMGKDCHSNDNNYPVCCFYYLYYTIRNLFRWSLWESWKLFP